MSTQRLRRKSFAVVAIAATAAAYGAEPRWWIGGGITFPQVRETAADFGVEATFSSSEVTFPQIAAERRGELVHLQFGYRKLDVLHFEPADRLTRTLGEAAGTGRYRQRWFGLQVLRPI